MTDKTITVTDATIPCDNERIEDGHIVPCERPAVARRIDEDGHTYPVCVGHVRHPMQPLTTRETRNHD